MIVERAAAVDMPAVDAIRSTYFASHGLAVQDRSPAAVWWAVRDGDAVVGCCCLEDVPMLRQRWLLDCYAVAGRAGKKALVALYDHLRANAIADHVAIVGMCEPTNVRQIKAYERRGAVVVGVMLRLGFEETPCLL